MLKTILLGILTTSMCLDLKNYKNTQKFNFKKTACIAGVIALHDGYHWYQQRQQQLTKKRLRTNLVEQNPEYLRITSLEKETQLPALKVTGTMPTWINGTMFRNGPAKFEVNDNYIDHLFDGFGMLHMFTFNKGNISYANKFLESNFYKKSQKSGTIPKSMGFGIDPCKQVFKGIASYFLEPSNRYDNGNVSIAKLEDTFVALTETPYAVAFDPQTLIAQETIPYKTMPSEHVATAHPHTDTQRGVLYNMLTSFGKNSTYNFYEVTSLDKEKKLLASVPAWQGSSYVGGKPSYVHSFGLSDNYIVLVEVPLRVNPLTLLFSNQAFIKNFTWEPQEGSIFTIINRHTGAIIKRIKTDAFFTFHHVNTFEHNGTIIVDLIAYKDATIIEELYMDYLIKHLRPKADHALTRFTLDLTSETITRETLSSLPLELPTIYYEKHNGKAYQYIYGVNLFDDSIVKIDTIARQEKQWKQKGCFPGEAIFVPHPTATQEDDGVLLSVVLDAQTRCSFLLVLDAKTLHEVARANVPHHIPFQLHGNNFFPVQSS